MKDAIRVIYSTELRLGVLEHEAQVASLEQLAAIITRSFGVPRFFNKDDEEITAEEARGILEPGLEDESSVEDTTRNFR